jgi:3-oxoacyl-[acyl-carrier protein] reductase
MAMLLENKTAVIYGAGGHIGGAVARAFAREGAKVFLAGRTLARLAAVARDIVEVGAPAETAQVDALDKRAVEAHLDEVVGKAGRLDISFNAIGIEDVQGVSLIDMSLDDFARPIGIGTTTQFLTAGAAARRMVTQGSGVILMITATPARLAIPQCGGFGVACAALEGLCRQLASEVGPQGVRVVCLRSAGSPESIVESMEEHARKRGTTREVFVAELEQGMLLHRFPSLAEVGNIAAMMASDLASPMTGTVANMTCGAIVD